MPAETPAQPPRQQLADELERLSANATPLSPYNWQPRPFHGTTDATPVEPEMTYADWRLCCFLRNNLPAIADALRAADAAPTPATGSDDITDTEIDETVGVVRAIDTITGSPSFDHELQIRDAGERGLGLVWDGDDRWAVMPDPFYTKEFLSTLRAQCNCVRRCKAAGGGGGRGEGR